MGRRRSASFTAVKVVNIVNYMVAATGCRMLRRGMDAVTLEQAELRTRAGVALVGPVTLHVGRGERWALLGPNGSGKTSLLALAGARRQPTAGRPSPSSAGGWAGWTCGSCAARSATSATGCPSRSAPRWASRTPF